jgi:Ca2+-binding RTX toxin-like protein
MRHASPLEPRRLFAAVFQGIPGYYEVTGTPGDDMVDIVVDQSAGTIAVNGVTYGGALHVSVDVGDGNDTVTVNSTGVGAISAAIRGGVGADHLTLNTDGAVWGDADNDVISLRNSFRGEAYGGFGDDQITLAGNCIDCQVEGNDGNDMLWALDNNYGVVLFGGAGNDRLYGSRFNDVIYDGPGSDFVFGLAGNDEFHSRDGEPDWIMGGDGSDTLFCDAREGGINSCEAVLPG